MKKWVLVLALATCSAAYGSQVSPQLLLVTKNSGFVPQEFSFSLKCDIHSDYVYVQQRTGRETCAEEGGVRRTVYTARVPDAAAARRFLEAAEQGDITERTGPTDGPTSTYVGVLTGKVVDRHIRLYLDYSSTRYSNTAEEARAALVEFGNANCQLAE